MHPENTTHPQPLDLPEPGDDNPDRYEELTRIRLEEPDAVLRAARARRRHPDLVYGQQNFIIAADHAARGALSVKSDRMAMGDRRVLLDRLRIALANPKVDGVLASPDLLDDLLLTGALEGKLIFGSMNRGGLPGLVNEIDDRFTGHTARALAEIDADGGKMLTRIAFDSQHTTSALEASAQAIDSLHELGLIAMVEPFLSTASGERVVNQLDPDAVITSVAIAQGLGARSARTWMKLPVVDEMERVMAATTLPTVLLGGEPSGRTEETLQSWQNALALPGVQGLTVGRTLLYPDDGNVEAAVEAAASLLNNQTEENP